MTLLLLLYSIGKIKYTYINFKRNIEIEINKYLYNVI